MSLRQISTIRNMPVLDLETGEVLGRVVSWVVKEKEQRLAAFLLNLPGPFKSALIIVPTDIVEYGPDMIVARDKDSIISPDDIVGLPELIAKKFVIIKFKAETKDGTKLGIIDDFVFDTINSEIKTYYISPSGITSLTGHDKIVPASQVIQIQPNKVVFLDEINKPMSKSAKEEIVTYKV